MNKKNIERKEGNKSLVPLERDTNRTLYGRIAGRQYTSADPVRKFVSFLPRKILCAKSKNSLVCFTCCGCRGEETSMITRPSGGLPAHPYKSMRKNTR